MLAGGHFRVEVALRRSRGADRRRDIGPGSPWQAGGLSGRDIALPGSLLRVIRRECWTSLSGELHCWHALPMHGCQEGLSFDVARADGSLWHACQSSHSGSSAVDNESYHRRYGIPRTSPVSAPMCGPSGVSSPLGGGFRNHWTYPVVALQPVKHGQELGMGILQVVSDTFPGLWRQPARRHRQCSGTPRKPPSDRGDRATQRVACPRLRAIDAGVQRVLPSWHVLIPQCRDRHQDSQSGRDFRRRELGYRDSEPLLVSTRDWTSLNEPS